MNKKMLSMITALTVAAGASGIAGARSIPASMGTATVGSTTGQFDYSPNTGSMFAGGVPPGTTTGWQIGLPVDAFGLKTVTVASRAINTAGNPSWRLVCSNQLSNAVFSSAFFFIPASAPFVLASRSASVPVGGVCIIDARLNTGAAIGTINYTP